MIELERHIEILLLDNDCVIVPGLGGFVAHHAAARYDDRDNMLLPPMRMLGFNPKLNMNDSLLAQSYVEAYDISYPEALTRISEEVDELMQNIERDGYYELDDIGMLELNADGNYVFSPCESGILTPELYGLAGVEMEQLQADDASEATSVRMEIRTNETAENKADEKIGSTQTTEEKPLQHPFGESKLLEFQNKSENNDKVIKIKLSVVRNFVAVACAIVAFFMLSTPITTDVNDSTTQMGNIGNGLLYNLVPKDGMRNAVVLNTEKPATSRHTAPAVKPQPTMAETTTEANSNAKAETESINSKPAEMAESKTANCFCIVMACRITKANAEEYVKKLQTKGYRDARVIGKEGSSLKVVYGNYQSEEDALTQLRTLRSNEIFKDSWIYHVK